MSYLETVKSRGANLVSIRSRSLEIVTSCGVNGHTRPSHFTIKCSKVVSECPEATNGGTPGAIPPGPSPTRRARCVRRSGIGAVRTEDGIGELGVPGQSARIQFPEVVGLPAHPPLKMRPLPLD